MIPPPPGPRRARPPLHCLNYGRMGTGVIVLAPGWSPWDLAARVPWLTPVVIAVTAGCVVLALGLLLAWRRPAGLRCLAAVAAGLVLLVAAHRLIAADLFVPRPFAADHFRPLFPHSPDTSFPSDTTGYFAVAVVPAALTWRWLGWAFSIMTVVVAFGCAWVGVHYVTDVVAGAAIGMSCGAGAWLILRCPPLAGLLRRADGLLKNWHLRPASAQEPA
jgi:membrane-associated phospholipid phosphatase